MADAGLKIVIGADISAVTDGMKVAAGNVAQFGTQAAKAFDEVAAAAGELQRTTDAIDQMAVKALGAGQQLDEAFQDPIKSIAHLEAQIESLERELSSTTDFATLKRLNEQIAITKTQLNNLKVVGFETTLGKINPAATGAANGINKVTSASKAGGAALTDINRVIQDSAFGFVGIQNNITELPGKFRALSAAAKETGTSVGKVLLSTLLGPAGVGTAISVITSALTFASVGFGAWTRGFTNSSKAAKDATSVLDEYNKLVQSVSGEVGKSASRITTLVNALQGDSLNSSQRKKALDELKSQNQEFFGALKEEKGLINGLQVAYDGYLQRIKAIATAKAIEAQLTKLFDKKLELELNVDPKFNAAVSQDAQKRIGALRRQLEKLGGPVPIDANQDITKLNDNLRKRLDLQTRIAKQESLNIVDLTGSREQLRQIELQIKGLSELQKFTGNFDITGAGKEKGKKDEDFLNKQLALLEKIRDAQKERVGNLFDLKEIDEATDKLAKLEQQVGDLKLQIAVRDAKKAKLPAAEIEKLKEAIKLDTQKRLNEAFEREALLLEFKSLKFSQVQKIEIPTNINFFATNKGKAASNFNDVVSKAVGLDKKIPIRTKFEIDEDLFGIDYAEFQKSLTKINEDLKSQIKDIFGSGVTDAFAAIGESFGDSLATGDFGEGLKKAAQSILGILGDVMQQLGKAVIAAAIKIKLLKETLTRFAIANPALAIIAGVGLIAAGAALKNIKFDGPKFAEGGIATGPVIGQVGERFRPEVILPLDRLPQLFKQFGGDVGGGMQLIPIINNEGLYLAMKRGERSAGRKF